MAVGDTFGVFPNLRFSYSQVCYNGIVPENLVVRNDMKYQVIDPDGLLKSSPEELVKAVDGMVKDAIIKFTGDEEDWNTYKSDKTAWADGYSRPDGEFINVEVTNASGDLDFGYVDFQGDLSKFIPLGNPRIFSVGSPASDVAKVELSKIDKSDMDAMSDLESLYAGFREGTAPDKDEWFSGYKLVIR